MDIKGIDFIAYNVFDLQRSIDFYHETLGLELVEEPGESWAEFDVGNATLSIMDHEPDLAGKGAAVALAVEDVGEAVDSLRAKGVRIIDEMYETPVCFGATVADPDGNKIYLHHRKDGTFGSA